MERQFTAAPEAAAQAHRLATSPGEMTTEPNEVAEATVDTSHAVTIATERDALAQIEQRIAQARTPGDAAKWAVIRETYLQQNERVAQGSVTRDQMIAEVVLKFGVTGGLAVLGGYMALQSLVLPGLAIIGGAIALISIEAGKQFFSVVTKIFKRGS